jgi:hypothetical protein
MLFEKKEIRTPPKEFQQAVEALQQVLEKDKRMGILLLIDPVRVFADAGIELSSQTRKYIRRKNPQFPYGNKRLYDAVKSGQIEFPWVKSVKFHFDREEN